MSLLLLLICAGAGYLLLNHLVPKERSEEYKKAPVKEKIEIRKKQIERKKPVKKALKYERDLRRSYTPGTGIISSLIGISIFAIVATAMLPILQEQIQLVSTGNNTTAIDVGLMSLWPTIIIIGGLLVILAAVGLG